MSATYAVAILGTQAVVAGNGHMNRDTAMKLAKHMSTQAAGTFAVYGDDGTRVVEHAGTYVRGQLVQE